MKLTALLLALTIGSTLATPFSVLDKRVDEGVYLCKNANFSGYCAHMSSPSGVCVLLGTDLNDQVGSVRPDQGSFCYFFVDPNCDDTADFFHVGYPGYPDLSVTPVNGPPGNTRNFKDKLSSYSCTDE